MTDEQAVQLLDLLCTYFEDYGQESDSPSIMHVKELAGDLIDSLSTAQVPHLLRKRLAATSLTADALTGGRFHPDSRKATP